MCFIMYKIIIITTFFLPSLCLCTIVNGRLKSAWKIKSKLKQSKKKVLFNNKQNIDKLFFCVLILFKSIYEK